MPTQKQRSDDRALIRTNLRRFVDEIDSSRGDRLKTNLSAKIAALQVAAVLNLTETLEAIRERMPEPKKPKPDKPPKDAP